MDGVVIATGMKTYFGKTAHLVGDPEPAPGVTRDDLILAAVLASRRDAPDAIDAAILAGVAPGQTVDRYVVKAFHPFDPVAKRAEAEIEHDGRRFKVAKGAPQAIVSLCEPSDEENRAIAAGVDRDAAKGYRTLGVARTDESGRWRFLGLLPLFDPPRDDCAETIKTIRSMGVDIKMVTGDHEAIAKEIAGKLGLGQNIVVPKPCSGKRTRASNFRALSRPTASRAFFQNISSRSLRRYRAPATSSA